MGQKYEQAETSQIGSLGCLVSPKKTFKKPSLSFSRYGAKRKTNPVTFVRLNLRFVSTVRVNLKPFKVSVPYQKLVSSTIMCGNNFF